MKHSRVSALLFVSSACVALNVWLISNRHYRWPLFVFAGAIMLLVVVLPKLPPPTRDPKEINDNILKASGSARRLGFLYVVGFAMAVLGLLTGEFKGVPVWSVAFMFAWGGFLIWACFRGAKWYKGKAAQAKQGPHQEIE